MRTLLARTTEVVRSRTRNEKLPGLVYPDERCERTNGKRRRIKFVPFLSALPCHVMQPLACVCLRRLHEMIDARAEANPAGRRRKATGSYRNSIKSSAKTTRFGGKRAEIARGKFNGKLPGFGLGLSCSGVHLWLLASRLLCAQDWSALVEVQLEVVLNPSPELSPMLFAK